LRNPARHFFSRSVNNAESARALGFSACSPIDCAAAIAFNTGPTLESPDNTGQIKNAMFTRDVPWRSPGIQWPEAMGFVVHAVRELRAYCCTTLHDRLGQPCGRSEQREWAIPFGQSLPVASIQQSLSASDGLSNTQDPSIKVQGIKVA
jgi:hypothetical protein